ncbi:MAG: helix-turn-helix domain-containing protein [Clostridia bacterium]|nr:helix-turn-helix domain-containing protein [Clostridia bacterium]
MLKENLVSLRKLKGKTQEEISEVAGVSRQAYAKWEKGNALPDVEKCCLLARYYGVTVESLLNKANEVNGVQLMPAPQGKHIWGVVTVNERGQIVIPREARELFSLKSGSRLVVLGDEREGIALVSAEDFEQKIAHMRELAAVENGTEI